MKSIAKTSLILLSFFCLFSAFAYDFSEKHLDRTIFYNVINASDTVYVTEDSIPCSNYYGQVTIPDSIIHNGKRYIVGGIDNSAFRKCEALTSVNIPKGVKHIGADAFRGCKRLTSIKLPAELREIGYCAFGQTSLDSIVIPDKVKEICGMAFMDCNFLKYANLSDSIKIIGDYAFMNCYGLKTINLPKNLEVIGRSAFFNCFSWGEDAYIGFDIKVIGLYAFGNCHNLKRIHCSGTAYIPFCEDGAFGDVNPIKKTVVVPFGTAEAYSKINVWKDFEKIEEE